MHLIIRDLTLYDGNAIDDEGESKFVQINNYIKSLSFVMNGINLIQLERKKCEA